MPRSDKSEKSPALLNEDGLAMLALEKTATDLHALAYPNPIYRALNHDSARDKSGWGTPERANRSLFFPEQAWQARPHSEARGFFQICQNGAFCLLR